MRSRLLTSTRVTNTITIILANSCHLPHAASGITANTVVSPVQKRNITSSTLVADHGNFLGSLLNTKLMSVTMATNSTQGKPKAKP